MIFNDNDIEKIRLFGGLIFTNPFSAERTEIEKNLLGRRHIQLYQVWHSVNGELSVNRNLATINGLCRSLVERGLSEGERLATESDGAFLEDWDLLAIYWLFAKYSGPMCRNIYLGTDAEKENAQLYDDFAEDFHRTIDLPGRKRPSSYTTEIIFALFHQIHRAFNYIFDFIAGGTIAAANLRASIWQSIFTCDLRRYYRQLYSRMNMITTLITGESGTGKELAARAIAFSQFIPFDPKARRFEQFYRSCFHPVQLSAMPQNLVESELFGHSRGAFTGAVEEHHGHFETCQPCGCILLDEIGEITPETQVKLLRLLQTRQFNRIGGNETITFKGKIIAATNTSLQDSCEKGRFRKDLLFRLCADTITTAPLRTLLDGREEELRQFVIILSKRLLDGEDAESFAAQCSDWIIANLGLEYPWPGNVRELEQCLRNLLIRGEYTPMAKSVTAVHDMESIFLSCGMDAESLMKAYVSALFKREKSMLGVARASGLDRRTVKKYLQDK